MWMIYKFFIEKIVFTSYDFISQSALVKYLKYLRKMDSLSAEELIEEQEKKLMSLLLHAKNNVPLYKNVTYKENPYEFDKQYMNRRNNGNLIAGLILIAIGAMFLIGRFVPSIDFADLWPVILVIAGIALLVPNAFKSKNNDYEK